MFLSIVIPAYNEEKNIARTLSEVSGYLHGKVFEHEIIVIDDGSTDATIREARVFESAPLNLRIAESVSNRGKGYAVKKGVLEAKGDYILFMDADGSTSIKELDKFLPFLGDDFDVYVASRRMSGSEVEGPVGRRVMGNVYMLLSRMLLGVSVSDINCGFKMFKKAAAKKIFSKQIMNDWSFDAEVLYLSAKYGCRIKEIPVKWEHKMTSNVRPFRDGIKSFFSLINIKMNDLRGRYLDLQE